MSLGSGSPVREKQTEMAQISTALLQSLSRLMQGPWSQAEAARINLMNNRKLADLKKTEQKNHNFKGHTMGKLKSKMLTRKK